MKCSTGSLMLIVHTEMFYENKTAFVKHGPTILYKFGHTRLAFSLGLSQRVVVVNV